MKKIYLTIFAIVVAVSSIIAQAPPTCSLNPTFIAGNKVGVWPDSATNFISGTVGQPYEQNLTIKVPKDTVSSGVTICFNRFVVSTATTVTNYNLPPGLMIGSSTAAVANGTVSGAPSLKFIGNANNCASIYGIPTVAGTYTLSLSVDAYGTPVTPFTPCNSPPSVTGGTRLSGQILNYYIITIAPMVGVQEIGKDKMSLSQNFPNPSSLTTDIKFYVEGEDNATITIYNLLGSVVSQQTIKTAVGENKVTINSAELPGGTYVYSLKYKGAVATKRMIVLNH